MQNEKITVKQINDFNKNTLIEYLGIEILSFDEDQIVARMPVDHRTHQPLGLLHGGASVVLIESLGSVGSSLLIDINKEYPVGLEVNANHISSVRTGNVIGVARIIHKGKKTHVWTTEIRDEKSNRLISSGRLTVMIVQKK